MVRPDTYQQVRAHLDGLSDDPFDLDRLLDDFFPLDDLGHLDDLWLAGRDQHDRGGGARAPQETTPTELLRHFSLLLLMSITTRLLSRSCLVPTSFESDSLRPLALRGTQSRRSG